MPQFVGYQLTENLNGSITVEYTPTTPGVHKISIDCNGSTVEGMPLWCVVQKADYGFITSYGPRLLEILSQPGFSDALGHEGLSLVQDGDTITVLTKEAASAAEIDSHTATEPVPVEQTTSSSTPDVLHVIPAVPESVTKLDPALSELSWKKEEPNSNLGVKQEPLPSADCTSVNNVEENTIMDVAASAVKKDEATQPKKDMFPCPFVGCPKLYGKEIYAKRCELDHLRQRKARRMKRKGRSHTSSIGNNVETSPLSNSDEKGHATNSGTDEDTKVSGRETQSDGPSVRHRQYHHRVDNRNSLADDLKRSKRTRKPTWKMLELESSGKKLKGWDITSPGQEGKARLKRFHSKSRFRIKKDKVEDSKEEQHSQSDGGSSSYNDGLDVSRADLSKNDTDEGKDDQPSDQDGCSASMKSSCGKKDQVDVGVRRRGGGRKRVARFECTHDGCGRVFKTVSARARHIQGTHHKQDLTKRSDVEDNEQEAQHTEGTTYKCKFAGCDDIYTTASDLRDHTHNNDHFVNGGSGQEGTASSGEMSSNSEVKEENKPVIEDSEKSVDDQKQFPCTYEGCGKVFAKIHHLLRHKNSHKAFPFQCHEDGCKKLFRFEESLSLHKFTYHGMKSETKRFECELCDKRFSSWSLLKKHQRVHTLETPYQCQDCQQRFKWQTSLLTHACLNKSGEGASLKCPDCGKIFNMRCLLKKHMVIHTDMRPFKCNQCEKSFKMRETLKKHLRKVHWSEAEKRKYAEKRGWICPDCDKVCTSIRDFHRHRTKHSDVRPFICDQCARQFKTQDGLNAHLKQMHSVTLIQKEDGTTEAVRTLSYYACDYPDCDKKFRRYHTFLEHKKIHYSSERIPCDHPGCNKTYPTLFKMKEHKRSVHKERPPVFCQICGKRMKNTSCLSNHMKLHSQINRIRCEYPGCDKSFTARTTLDRHILMKHQTPTKLYECTYENCKKSFKLKCLLEQHLQSHSTERNFRCEICSNTYKTINTLRSHVRTHDKTKQHQCVLCGKHFPRKNRYLTHLATHHAGEVQVITTGDSISLNNIEQVEQIDASGDQVQYLKPETIIQTITETGEAEVTNFSTIPQVVEEKSEITYQDALILPNSQIIEFTTNYQ